MTTEHKDFKEQMQQDKMRFWRTSMTAWRSGAGNLESKGRVSVKPPGRPIRSKEDEMGLTRHRQHFFPETAGHSTGLIQVKICVDRMQAIQRLKSASCEYGD